MGGGVTERWLGIEIIRATSVYYQVSVFIHPLRPAVNFTVVTVDMQELMELADLMAAPARLLRFQFFFHLHSRVGDLKCHCWSTYLSTYFSYRIYREWCPRRLSEQRFYSWGDPLYAIALHKEAKSRSATKLCDMKKKERTFWAVDTTSESVMDGSN